MGKTQRKQGIFPVTVTVIVLAGVLALTACSPRDTGESTVSAQEITLIATDIAYDAERIEAAVGQPIRLTLSNQGVLEHDFSILEVPLSGEATVIEPSGEAMGHDMGHVDEEPAVHVAVPAGGRAVVEFVPAAPGEYEFYCTVSGHREAGMHGTLIVTES